MGSRIHVAQNWMRGRPLEGKNGQALDGCGRYNTYVSSRGVKPNVIDARCKSCNRRVKFKPGRYENRGQFRPVQWIECEPEMNVIEECQLLNGKGVTKQGGFVRASTL